MELVDVNTFTGSEHSGFVISVLGNQMQRICWTPDSGHGFVAWFRPNPLSNSLSRSPPVWESVSHRKRNIIISLYIALQLRHGLVMDLYASY